MGRGLRLPCIVVVRIWLNLKPHIEETNLKPEILRLTWRGNVTKKHYEIIVHMVSRIQYALFF